jgi:hypothetical protein
LQESGYQKGKSNEKENSKKNSIILKDKEKISYFFVFAAGTIIYCLAKEK